MYQSCVRDNYLSVYFPIQPFLLLSCFSELKAFSFSTFPIFHETDTPALQLSTKWYWKDWWCPKINKIKTHKVCFLWTSYKVFLLKKRNTLWTFLYIVDPPLAVLYRLNNIIVRWLEWRQMKHTVFSEKCVIDFDVIMASHFQ